MFKPSIMRDAVSFNRQQTCWSNATHSSIELSLDDELADFHKLIPNVPAWTDAILTRKRNNRHGRRQNRRRERRRLRVLQSILPPSQQIAPTLHPILEVDDETRDDKRLFLFRSLSNSEILIPGLQHEQGLSRVLSLDDQQHMLQQNKQSVIAACHHKRGFTMITKVQPQENDDEDSLMNMSCSISTVPLAGQPQVSTNSLDETEFHRQISELRYVGRRDKQISLH